MNLDAHLDNSKKGFLIFAAGLVAFVGGLSFYFAGTAGNKIFGAEPVRMDILDSGFAEISGQGRVAGAFSAQTPSGEASSMPVLVYHGIVDKADGVNVTKQQFLEQMKELAAAGWQTVSLDDFGAFARGDKKLPTKSFLLTFDDGRKDSFYGADPVLKLLGFRATMFVITGSSFNDKTTYYLNRNELAFMRDSGRWDLGAHAQVGHDPRPIDGSGNSGNFLSNRIWLEQKNRLETEEEYHNRVATELSGIKTDLKNQLGVVPAAYAFPYGDYGVDSKNVPNDQNFLLAEVAKNYSTAFTQTRSDTYFTQNYPENSAFYLAKRITVEGNWQGKDLLNAVTAGIAKELPWSEDFSNSKDWVPTWGNSVGQNGVQVLSPTASSTGASVYLDGGNKLSKYKFSSLVQLKAGQSFSLLAAYIDDNNYLSCNYSSAGITINEVTDGRKKEVSSWWFKFPQINSEEISAGIELMDGRARCLLNGKVVLTTDRVSEKLIEGSVGFKVWDPQPDKASLIIKKAVIEPISE
ncbi:MAG: polysaccharide deacetylase family protein [Candidatus Doudnabacteria bacterium]|nr:polysaccharide deacetylase family protein [Candidatus Doudnabacteria bacterium]